MKSRYAGVIWDSGKNLWSAQAKLDGYAHHVGWYADEEKAAEAIWVRLGHSGVRDADTVDVEQDERWDHVAGSDFAPTLPDRVRTRGARPAPTTRQGTPHPSAPVPPAGALTPS